MDRDKVIELAENAGFGKYAHEAAFIFVEFAALVEKETLEKVAKHFEEKDVYELFNGNHASQEILNLKGDL